LATKRTLCEQQFWPNFCYANHGTAAVDEIIDLLWENKKARKKNMTLLLHCLLMLHRATGSHLEVLDQFKRIPQMTSVMIPAMLSYVEGFRGSNGEKTGLSTVLSRLIGSSVKNLPDQTDAILNSLLGLRIFPSRYFLYLTASLKAVADLEKRRRLYAHAVSFMRERNPQVALDLTLWASTEGVEFEWPK